VAAAVLAAVGKAARKGDTGQGHHSDRKAWECKSKRERSETGAAEGGSLGAGLQW